MKSQIIQETMYFLRVNRQTFCTRLLSYQKKLKKPKQKMLKQSFLKYFKTILKYLMLITMF